MENQWLKQFLYILIFTICAYKSCGRKIAKVIRNQTVCFPNKMEFNPILNGGQICPPPPAGFLNIVQKPLGLGSWTFVTSRFNI